jgi:hypothetical protein
MLETENPRLEAVKTLIVRDPALSVGVFTVPTIKFATLTEFDTYTFPETESEVPGVPMKEIEDTFRVVTFAFTETRFPIEKFVFDV